MVSMVLNCLPGGLNGELVMDIANRKPLSIDCTDRDAPFLLRNSGQLWDVGGALQKNKALYNIYQKNWSLEPVADNDYTEWTVVVAQQ